MAFQDPPRLRVGVRLTSYQTSMEATIVLDVDPSSLYTWIPRDVAERIGVARRDVWRFQTKSGGRSDRPVGDVRIEIEGHSGPTVVIFAELGDRLVLGDLALTTVGLELDPATSTLREMDYFLALPAR